jgi:hypothetical protein
MKKKEETQVFVHYIVYTLKYYIGDNPNLTPFLTNHRK